MRVACKIHCCTASSVNTCIIILRLSPLHSNGLCDSMLAACHLQVHKAKLKFSGTIVAVKVQYPDSLDIMLQASSCIQSPLYYKTCRIQFKPAS